MGLRNTVDPGMLTAALAEAEAAEAAELQTVRDEVYIGFHELDSLLPAGLSASEVLPPDSPTKPISSPATPACTTHVHATSPKAVS